MPKHPNKRKTRKRPKKPKQAAHRGGFFVSE